MPRKGYVKQHISGVELAKKAKVYPSFITECRAKGLFDGAFRKKRGRKGVEYHEEKCLAILKDLDVSKKRKGGNGSQGRYTDARVELVIAQKRKLDFDHACKERRYVEAEEVNRRVFTIVRNLRDQLLNMPAKCAAVVAAKSKKSEKQVYCILLSEVERALKECHEDFRKLCS